MNNYLQKQHKWLEQYYDNHDEIIHGFTVATPENRSQDQLIAFCQLDRDIWQVDFAFPHIPASVAKDSPAYAEASKNMRTLELENDRLFYMFSTNVTENVCALRVGQNKPAFCLRYTMNLEDDTMDVQFRQGICHADRNMSFNAFAKSLIAENKPLRGLTEYIIDHQRYAHSVVTDQAEPPPFDFGFVSPKTARRIPIHWAQLTNYNLAAYAQTQNLKMIYEDDWTHTGQAITPSHNGNLSLHYKSYSPYARLDNPLDRFTDVVNAFVLDAHLNGLDDPYTQDERSGIITCANSIQRVNQLQPSSL